MIVARYPTCSLCEGDMTDEYQVAEFMTKAGKETAHKSCLYQLMLASWDELGWRHKKGIPIDAPYDSKHIANPAIRKALMLDKDPEQRLIENAQGMSASEAVLSLYQSDEDGFFELVERAYERDMRHLEYAEGVVSKSLPIMNKSF